MSKLFRTPAVSVQIVSGVHCVNTVPGAEMRFPPFLQAAAVKAGCVPVDGVVPEQETPRPTDNSKNRDALAKMRDRGEDDVALKRDQDIRKTKDPRAPVGDHPPVDEGETAPDLPPLEFEVDTDEPVPMETRLQPYIEALVNRGLEADFLVSSGRPRISSVRREAHASEPSFPDITPVDVAAAWDRFNEHRGTEPAQ